MATFTKKKIQEIIDDEGNLIGTDDLPKTGANKETEASHTTDHNVNISHQQFKNDFLGRFGFYFYESEGNEKPEVIKALENAVGKENTSKAMTIIKPFFEKAVNEMNSNINESNVLEDKITKKDLDNDIVKKNKNDLTKKVERVADLLSKLSKNDLNKLMSLLESKRKK